MEYLHNTLLSMYVTYVKTPPLYNSFGRRCALNTNFLTMASGVATCNVSKLGKPSILFLRKEVEWPSTQGSKIGKPNAYRAYRFQRR